MKNARYHSDFIFLGILVLGFSINYAQIDDKEVSAHGDTTFLEKSFQTISLSKKKKKSAKHDVFKNACAKVKRIMQSVDSKKACCFLLVSSAVISAAYGTYQYWPLIEALWDDKKDMDVTKNNDKNDTDAANNVEKSLPKSDESTISPTPYFVTLKNRFLQDVHPHIIDLENKIYETMHDPEFTERLRVKCEKIEENVRSFCVQAWLMAEPGIQAALKYGKKLYTDYKNSQKDN